jgi:hypothetical protein
MYYSSPHPCRLQNVHPLCVVREPARVHVEPRGHVGAGVQRHGGARGGRTEDLRQQKEDIEFQVSKREIGLGWRLTTFLGSCSRPL